MAQVPALPSNGQPIDTQYIYDIVSSLISINGEIATTGTSNIKASDSSDISSKTNNLKFQAQAVVVAAGGTKVSKDSPTTGAIQFKEQFTSTPIVTATLVSKTNSTVKSSVTITGADTSNVYYQIDFDSTGTVGLELNIIAIGV